MSKKIKRTDHYEATPDAVLAMLSDSEYVAAKYQSLGDSSTEILEHTTTDTAMTLKVDRQVPSDLPDFAKKVLGETNHLVQTESWMKAGDGWVCDLKIESPGKPLTIGSRSEIVPSGDGSDWNVDMEIKASIPLVGGKLEGVVEKETLASMDKEYGFNKVWLSSH
jgi:hypothetical protein